MRLSFGRPAIPAEIKAAAELQKNERVLGWSRSGADGWVVATDRALLMHGPTAAEVDETLRMPWVRVAKATWAEGQLQVVGAVDEGGPSHRFTLDVDEDARLPEAIRACVTHNVVISRKVTRESGEGAWISARRSDDGLVWSVLFDPGVDASDPDFRAWADHEVAQLKEQIGQ